MNRFFALAVLFLSSVPAYAMPQFLQLYRGDPFRNPNVDGCITCHMSPEGGDARNPFGQAFERGGEQITPMLRAQFPDRFVYPTSRISDALTIHFSDPDKKQVVVEAAGTKNLVDVDKIAVNGASAARTPTTETASISTARPARSEVPVDSYAREGAYFGSNIVNLPDGKPQKAGGVDFFVGHRFGQDVSAAGLGGLFGFDSTPLVAYGVRVGLTNRLSVSVVRSSLKTISLMSAFQVSRQNPTMPVTLQLLAGADGERNFGLYHNNDPFNPIPRRYSPVLQAVATRTFKDRVSFTMVPTFAFNTRDEHQIGIDEQFFPLIGIKHNDTIFLGLGAGVRVLPTTSIVGEYIPRLWGFKGEFKDPASTDPSNPHFANRPGVSIGLQKSTFRHTFELLISRQQAITPALYSSQGLDTFKVGFNIYRRMR